MLPLQTTTLSEIKASIHGHGVVAGESVVNCCSLNSYLRRTDNVQFLCGPLGLSDEISAEF